MSKTPDVKPPFADRSPALGGLRNVAVAVLLGGLLLGAYANTFGVPFIFDDRDSIITNTTLRAWSTALFPPTHTGITVSGRPILNFSFAVNYVIGGRSVMGYHVTNLLIHFAGAVTLFGLVRRTWLLSRNTKFEDADTDATLAAFLVAALWALHPLQTESVTYVVQRAESLVGLFFLLTLYCFSRYVQGPRQAGWLVASVVACCLGMGSKEVMIGAPLVVLYYDRVFISGSFKAAWTQRRWYYTGLFISWLFLFACIASTGSRGGTVGYAGSISVWLYLLTQCEAIIRYLGLVFWPYPQVMDYGRHVVGGVADVWLQGVALLVLISSAFWSCRRWPKIGFLGLSFFIVLAPTSSFVPVISQTMAEHRIYLALAFLVTLAVWTVHARWGRKGLLPLLGLVPLLAGISFARNSNYRTEYSIWSDTAKKWPSNSRAWFVSGFALSREERYEEARTCLERALKLEPENSEGMSALASLLENIGRSDEAVILYKRVRATFKDKEPSNYGDLYYYGMALMGTGEVDASIDYLRKATQFNPEMFEAHYVLGNALLKKGLLNEAIDALKTAVTKAPEMVMARANLGNALNKAGRYDEAIEAMQSMLEGAPRSSELRVNLGVAYQGKGRLIEARAMYTEALKIRPELSQPHLNLALLSMAEQKIEDACEHFRMAIVNGDRNPVLLATYGRALCATGRSEEGLTQIGQSADAAPVDIEIQYVYAMSLLAYNRWSAAATQFERVLNLAPTLAEAHNGLGVAYRELGRVREARLQFAEAVRLRADYAEARGNLEKLDNL